MKPVNTPKNIITVGGSLGGLMASVAMRRLGHRVRVLERSSTPLLHDQGAGIVFGDDTRDFFDKYDRTRTPLAVKSKERLYLGREGNVIDREARAQHMTSWDLLYHVLRANFDGFGSDYIEHVPQDIVDDAANGGAIYQHGALVTSVQDIDSGVEVSWKSTLSGNDAAPQLETLLADSIIVADGSSSTMRPILSPASPKKIYAGYVAFRGTVSESNLSPAAHAVFCEKFVFYHGDRVQVLSYLIPGRNGSIKEGERLVNWVWYWNVELDSEEYKQILTDRHGNLHRFTLPPGDNMDPQVWETQKQRAKTFLPPQFAELVAKTEKPFVQAITDLPPPVDGPSWYLNDNKAVLVGDAVSGFRPHTAGSTGQAAHHALMLPEVKGVFNANGSLTTEEYEGQVLMHAVTVQKIGVQLGDRSQFGIHPLRG